MRITFTLSCLLFVLNGCGGGSGGSSSSDPTGPNEPEPDPTGPLSVTLISGDNQTGEVTTRLPDPLTVQATRDGQPVVGQVVNFVVTSGEGGQAFAGSASTDEEGRAADFWVLGTGAGEHTMEVRSVDSSGDLQVWGSFTATAVPGPIDSLRIDPQERDRAPAYLLNIAPPDPETLDLSTIRYSAWDQYGNAISDAVAAWTADSPLSINGDLLSASGETYGFVYLTAEFAKDSLIVTSLRDLFQGDWKQTATCYNGVYRPDNDTPYRDVDSARVVLTEPQPGEPMIQDTINQGGLYYRLEYRWNRTGTATTFFADGDVSELSVFHSGTWEQSPDTLEHAPNDVPLIKQMGTSDSVRYESGPYVSSGAVTSGFCARLDTDFDSADDVFQLSEHNGIKFEVKF